MIDSLKSYSTKLPAKDPLGVNRFADTWEAVGQRAESGAEMEFAICMK